MDSNGLTTAMPERGTLAFEEAVARVLDAYFEVGPVTRTFDVASTADFTLAPPAGLSLVLDATQVDAEWGYLTGIGWTSTAFGDCRMTVQVNGVAVYGPIRHQLTGVWGDLLPVRIPLRSSPHRIEVWAVNIGAVDKTVRARVAGHFYHRRDFRGRWPTMMEPGRTGT